MAIVIDKVSFKHNKNEKKKTISNISLEIFDKNICGIIGKSGSGKTTLLELIDGLIKPDEGKVLIDDIDINKDKSIRREIGFVFQFPEQQFFEQSVRKEIEFSAKNYGIRKEKVKDVIKLVGLNEDILNKKLNNLSNGERRMIAIASILIYNPSIILFDEPTIGLDYKNKKIVIQLIKNLKNRFGKTIIIVSHDVDLLYSLCDKLIIINDGKLLLYGDTLSVYKEIDIINKYNIPIPNIVLFENYVKSKKNIKLMNSKTINDLIKEVYRNV